MRSGRAVWLLRAGLIVCCAALPWLAGVWCAAAVLLALPILRALLDAMGEHAVSRICVLCGGVSAARLLPAWLWPAVAFWIAGLLALSLLRLSSGRRALLGCAALTALTCVAVLVCAWASFREPPIPLLAQFLTDLIDRQPNSAELLLGAYQSGLARLEGSLAMTPAVRLFQMIFLPVEVRRQLLNSLRTTIETLLSVYLPQWLTAWGLFTSLFSALAAEGYLLSRGRHSDFPPLAGWYLPRRLAGVTALLTLGNLLTLLSVPPVFRYFGAMCGTLGYWLWALQGASLLIFLLQMRGAKTIICVLAVALGVTVFPLALLLLGCWDQFRDPRGLRGFGGNDTI